MRFRIVGCVLLLTAAVVPADAVGATEDMQTDSITVVLARQQQIHVVTDRIWDLVSREQPAGFAGIAQAEDATSFTVYWKGTPPAWLTTLVGTHAAPSGRVAGAAYSRRELTTAIERVLNRTARSAEYRLAWVAGNHDGSGLSAGVIPQPDVGHVRRLARSEQTVLAQAHADLAGLARVPIAVSATRWLPRPMSRDNDQAPWKAGGARDGENCSISFAIRTAAGHVRILTARHCGGDSGDVVRDGTNSDVIGHITVQDQSLDSQLIDPTSTLPGYGWVFKGPWFSSSTIRVEGSTYSNVNDYVCTSGQMSGTHCNLRVIDDYFFPEPIDPGLPPGPYKLARAAPGSSAVTGGDSGGAVYDPTASGGALATGVIAGGGAEIVPCRTRDADPGGACFMNVLYISYMAILGRWNATTITG